MSPRKRDQVGPLTRPLSSEHGFALPIVMLALFACFALASAAVLSSLAAQGGVSRDQGSKAALAAAEAGVANAMLRFNRIPAEQPCEPVGGGATSAGGWCPETPETMSEIDRGSYRYAVHPTPTELKIVSTGTVDGVNRRVSAIAQSAQSSSGGIRPFATAGVVGLDSIELRGDAVVNANVATNGDIELSHGATINCEHAQVGEGEVHELKEFGVSHATCEPTHGATVLPPVNPGNVMLENSNDRICTLDPIAPAGRCSEAWQSSSKKLVLNKGMSITLGAAGGEFNYAFCQIILNSNSYLYIAAGATVRIYFGAPKKCGDTQRPLQLNAGSKIEPTEPGASNLAMLVVGAEEATTAAEATTTVELNAEAILSTCEQSFVLYAPRSKVQLNKDTHLCGGIAAKSIEINHEAEVTASNTATEFELPKNQAQYFLGFGHPQFIECTSVAPGLGEPPDSGC